MAVAQAEATVTRARERTFQASAERVRALEALVGLAEALSAAGDRLASSSVNRSLTSSREAAVAISDAQAALSRARAAAQGDAGAWLSGAAAIAETIATAGDLVRRAERAADGPAVVRSTTTTAGSEDTPGRGGGSGGDDASTTAVAEAEARATAWLDADKRGNDDKSVAQSSSAGGGGGLESSPRHPQPAKRAGERRAKIGFGDGREGAPTYMPLWMRLQKKAWELGAAVIPDSDSDKKSGEVGSRAKSGDNVG